MKYSIIILAICFCLGSCKKDNYDAPTSFVDGKVTYQGEVLGVRSLAHNLQLYQTGFGLYTPLATAIDQEGTFSARIFDGSYKLIMQTSTTQPWIHRPDTMNFEVRGTTEVNYEVLPYYMIRNAVYTKSGTNMTATCTIEKIAPAATFQNATLYVSRTAVLDQNFKEASVQITPTNLTNVSFSVAIPQRLLDQGYCFVRIGVKPAQSAERIYTQIKKIEF